jgi:hypothetical protein
MKLEFAVLLTHPAGHIVAPHWHDVRELVVYLSGSGTTTFRKREYPYRPETLHWSGAAS